MQIFRRFKQFLKHFLPSSAMTLNSRLDDIEGELYEQRMLTLQLMMQIQRLSGKGRDELLTRTYGRAYRLSHVLPHGKLHFEMDLCGHCNLKCEGCAHFSPLAGESFTDLDEARKSFERLSELAGGEVEYIHLLGGEPLLHPQVTDFFEMARECFPVGRIELVTNGVLLPTMPESFWQVAAKERITISVTKYPIKLDIEKIFELASKHDVTLQFYNHSDEGELCFQKLTLDLSGGQDATESFMDCYLANECIFLKDGRLYPCSIISHVNYFNDYFDQNLPVTQEDSIDIWEAQSLEEIMDFVSRPVPFCRFCNIRSRQGGQKWKMGKQEISEWT